MVNRAAANKSPETASRKNSRRPGPHPAPDRPKAAATAAAARPPAPAPRFGVVALGLIAAVLAIYLQALRFQFINYDTEQFVMANEHVRSGLSLAGVRWAFTTIHGGYWMPLTWLSHMLDCSLYGLHPWGHILSSVLLHAANAVLLLLALWRLTGAFWRSALVAAIFAVHPLRVESVVWVAERKDVLSALWCMLTLLAYNHYARGAFAWRRYALVLLTLALGLLAKPSVVTLPCLLLLLDFWPLRRWQPAGEAMRTDAPPARPATLPMLLLEKAPLMALAMACSALTYQAQSSQHVVADIPLAIRLCNVPIHYAMYLGKIFWPFDLTVIYQVEEHFPPAALLTGAVVLIGGLTLAAGLAWRRRPYLAAGWCWFLGMLVPMIGIVQVFIASIADRYTYLAQTGLMICLAWGLGEMRNAGDRRQETGGRSQENFRFQISNFKFQISNLPFRNPQSAISLVVLALLMLRAGHQVSYWRDNVTLWTHATEVSPDSAFAWASLGVSYSKLKDAEHALPAEQRAVALTPGWPEYQRNIALTYDALGELDAAVEHFQTSLAIRPNDAQTHLDFGQTLVKMHREAEAAEHFSAATRLDPNNAEAWAYLGSAAGSRGDTKRARELYQEALKHDSRNFMAHLYLGIIALMQGDTAGGQKELETAASIDPESPNPLFQLGQLWGNKGDQARAEGYYREALRLAEKNGETALAGQIRARMGAGR